MTKTKLFALGMATALAFATTGTIAHADGAKVFKKKCRTCHKIDRHGVGPMLKGVVGRTCGTSGFKKHGKDYKAACSKHGFTLDEAFLDAWLANPKVQLGKLVGKKKGKTSMSARLRKKADRDAVITFLKSL